MSDIVKADLNADMFREFSGDHGFAREDMAVPFLRVLQTNSPQLARGNSKFVDRAQAGDFFNTATGELVSGEQGLIVVPCVFMRSYTEWKSRNDGGGLVKDWGQDASVLDRTRRDTNNRNLTEDGHYIVESMNYYVLSFADGGDDISRAVLPLASTQLKKGRQWNTTISQLVARDSKGNAFNPPMFYMSWRLTTVPESNDRGNWMGVKIAKHKPILELPMGPALFEMATSFVTLIKSGDVKVRHEDLQDEPGTPTSTAGGAPLDDNIPF